MSARTKSPLHPSALSLNDIQPGRRVIRFNRHYGITMEAVVLRKPYVFRQRLFDDHADLVVDLLSVNGYSHYRYLSDMGVIPYSGPNSGRRSFWNGSNFTIDARKRHLLPEIVPKSPEQLEEDAYWDAITNESELDYVAW